MRKLGIVFFPAFDWAISKTHPEREERLLYTQDQLREEGLFDLENVYEFKPELATFSDVEAAHFCVPGVEEVCSASHLASAGGAITALSKVLSGEVDKAFALVRPPGHHAMRVSHGNRGFCNVNIEAIMLEKFRQQKPRVAIVDTDCHHGDGTQDIYWNDPDTLFISLHQDGRTLYPGTGFLEEHGGPGALGKNINIPLPPGTGDAGYLYAMQEMVLPILADFKPDLIVNSAGQDNHYTDPLTNMQLTAGGYAKLTEMLSPHISVLEGGYSIRTALPYVNLAICLALADLPYAEVHEPDYNEAKLQESPKVMEYIKRLGPAVLDTYFSPKPMPYEGKRQGQWWVRERDIYYDTDGLHEHRLEKTKLCANCPGVTWIETRSVRGSGVFKLLPHKPCNSCAESSY